MNKIGIVAIAVVILLIASAGIIIPGLSLLDEGTTTVNGDFGGISGSGELIGPNDRKGFITSYMDVGFSETITCIGRVCADTWAVGGMTHYRYFVYGKENSWSSYELLSEPGTTSMYLSPESPNPGERAISGIQIGGCKNLDDYSFEFVGNKYKAVKVVCQGRIDWNVFDPFDNGYQWRNLQIDEAYLYEGYGSLTLPTDIEDGIERPYDTFEIGQTVDIRVETAKGGQTVEGTGTWRVTLNEPYSGGITDPGLGGGVVVEKYYDDDTTNGHFSFVVTKEMADKSMSSTDPYSVRIWNTMLPKGTLYVDFVDFIHLCPGDVTLTGETQSRVGETTTVTLTASINSETQLPIDYFRVSVIYGTSNVLLPGDPNSNNWIIHTTNIQASGNSATISFIPTKESYVTVHGKAFDTDGRGSIRTKTWTLWAYAETEVPDDVVDDETGEDDYGGGHTDPWLPWDPSGGNWGEVAIGLSIIGIIVAIVIAAVFAILGLLAPGSPYVKVAIIVAGIVIAVVVYLYFFA